MGVDGDGGSLTFDGAGLGLSCPANLDRSDVPASCSSGDSSYRKVRSGITSYVVMCNRSDLVTIDEASAQT
jgi:hypothetical protein